ncbi:MAG: endonuclease Q family protein, partial [archaeon]
MKLYADLHIHSRFSRATSKNLTIENLEKYAKIKGINLLGTGDFTHPKWLAELREKLSEDGSGFLKTKSGFKFILQSEVSQMYRQDDKGRRVHNIILAPSFEVVDQINEFLAPRGKLASDGRPIFSGLDCKELCENLFEISEKIEIIPAHIWTPWFSVLGSKSGFDSIEECFGEYTSKIHALETGLSSDPAMNWRVSKLDRFTLVSNSDTHSFWPWRLGRECNVLDIEPTYDNLQKALKTREGFEFTVEVDPSYGKYHFDGHRKCDVCLEPKESLKNQNKCPKCGKPLTIGVLNRVEELADREEGYAPKNAVPFKTLLPLSEIIALSVGVKSPASSKVDSIYYKLIEKFGSEFNVLIEAQDSDIENVAGKRLSELIIRNRNNEIKVSPGY